MNERVMAILRSDSAALCRSTRASGKASGVSRFDRDNLQPSVGRLELVRHAAPPAPSPSWIVPRRLAPPRRAWPENSI
jgi:hypothetical protein